MKKPKPALATRSFEKAVANGRTAKYVLKLYLAGASERSRRALAHARHLCDVELRGNCDLEVIDVYQQPILARDSQIVATPTLVKEYPLPVLRFIGTLENADRMLGKEELDTPDEITS